MDREAVSKQMKALKSKAKTARKAGKREIASSFRAGAARLGRKLRASARPAKKEEAKAEEAPKV